MNNILPCNIEFFLKSYAKQMKGSPNAIQKIKLSIKEFEQCRKEYLNLRKIEIYPYRNEKDLVNDMVYTIKIMGRKDTYYQGRIICFYLFIFDTYPEDPPQIIAPSYRGQAQQKPFLHLNMDQNGHVCMLSNQKDKQYYKYTTLKDILIELQNMIYNPNIGSSYPGELFSCFKQHGDNSLYFQKLNHQAKFLQHFDVQQSDSNSDSNSDK